MEPRPRKRGYALYLRAFGADPRTCLYRRAARSWLYLPLPRSAAPPCAGPPLQPSRHRRNCGISIPPRRPPGESPAPDRLLPSGWAGRRLNGRPGWGSCRGSDRGIAGGRPSGSQTQPKCAQYTGPTTVYLTQIHFSAQCTHFPGDGGRARHGGRRSEEAE